MQAKEPRSRNGKHVAPPLRERGSFAFAGPSTFRTFCALNGLKLCHLAQGFHEELCISWQRRTCVVENAPLIDAGIIADANDIGQAETGEVVGNDRGRAGCFKKS
jgi:hypothetical protein